MTRLSAASVIELVADELPLATQRRVAGCMLRLAADAAGGDPAFGPVLRALDAGRAPPLRAAEDALRASGWSADASAAQRDLLRALPYAEGVSSTFVARLAGSLAESGAVDPAAVHVVLAQCLARARDARLRRRIADYAARTFFVSAWMSREEEAGRTGGWGGRNLMDLAPPTSGAARAYARKWAAGFERKNRTTLDAAYLEAVARDPDGHAREPTADAFGFALAMEAMGSGVAWSDSHPRHGWDVPDGEFYL